MKYHGFHVMMPASYSYMNKLTTTTDTPVESNKVEYGCVKNAMFIHGTDIRYPEIKIPISRRFILAVLSL